MSMHSTTRPAADANTIEPPGAAVGVDRRAEERRDDGERRDGEQQVEEHLALGGLRGDREEERAGERDRDERVPGEHRDLDEGEAAERRLLVEQVRERGGRERPQPTTAHRRQRTTAPFLRRRRATSRGRARAPPRRRRRPARADVPARRRRPTVGTWPLPTSRTPRSARSCASGDSTSRASTTRPRRAAPASRTPRTWTRARRRVPSTRRGVAECRARGTTTSPVARAHAPAGRRCPLRPCSTASS